MITKKIRSLNLEGKMQTTYKYTKKTCSLSVLARIPLTFSEYILSRSPAKLVDSDGKALFL